MSKTSNLYYRGRDYLYLFIPTEQVSPDDGYRIHCPKLNVLNKRQDDG
jgi:hypothetical protein